MTTKALQQSMINTLKNTQYTDDAAQERSFPIYVKNIGRKSLVSVLEKYVKLWEPRDIRLSSEYQDTHRVESTDDVLIKDIAKGMKVSVEERIPSKNTLKVAVMFQHNLAEFERYDSTVDAHNEQWVNQGCPEDVMDPTTGDIFEVEDKYLNHASDENPAPFGESTGHLARSKPKARRKKLLTVTYKVKVLRESNMFQLDFSAVDNRGRTVYFNSLKNKNLAYLTRRATQELYGNPEAFGNKGPFLEGISMLVTGKKIGRCFSKNTAPDEQVTRNVKNAYLEQGLKSGASAGTKTIANLVRYLVPWIGVIGIIASAYRAFQEYITVQTMFIYFGLNLALIYASIFISGRMLRHAFDIDVDRRFS